MRRVLLVSTMMLFAAAVLMTGPGSAQSVAVQVTLPGTNTPRPAAFATNTPVPPTATPTATFTPSLTPTATFTPSNTPTPSETPTNTPSPTPTPIGPISYPEGVNTLTGLPFPDEASMNRRNLIVKISNYPPVVRPQYSVNLADVVYEVEAEGGVTRFAAIFRSNMPEHVGSVRSARLSDLELIEMYNALLAYSGTSEPIQRLILRSPYVYQFFSPLKGDNCEEAGFCRFPQEGKAFEHTLYLDTTQLYALADQRNVSTGYPARGFAFNETADQGGATANDIFIDWYGQTDARWQYDAESGHYIRWTDSKPHIDANDGEQLWADNLVIIQVPHERRPDLFAPGVNYESLEIQLWGQGPAVLVRDGKWYQGFWKRECNNTDVTVTPTIEAEPAATPEIQRDCYSRPGTALQLMYGNNQPMMMKPGRTWVSVVRGFGDVVLSEQAADMEATIAYLEANASPTPTATPEGGPTATPFPD
ncbi:MAG: DUF3048 domain-containing protein [Anaerolineae bacterium]|nr:DUF3048 domain-containing protein [Anaerolineae bacterium]